MKASSRVKFLYEDEESLSLMVKKCTMADAGKYSVKASNDLGEVTTDAILLVKGKPS